MRLFRVFPYDHDAAAGDPGGALFVPAGGKGRFDNPSLYRMLYTSTTAEGAVAETFGNLEAWRPGTFVRRIGSKRVPFALAEFDVPDPRIIDLARIDMLEALEIEKVTDIVSRDRTRTQTLAAKIYDTGTYQGLAWWSFYNPVWTNVGLWDRTGLKLVGDPQVLTVAHPGVVAAAQALPRLLIATRRGPSKE